MRKLTLVVVTLALLSMGINVAGQSPSADHAKIQGVWRLMEETRPAVKQPPTPYSSGLWIFSGNHHSIMGEIFRERPRPRLDVGAPNPPLDVLRAAYDEFYARAGTFEIEPGNIL